MKRRAVALVALVLVVCQLLTLGVYAVDGDGWGLWDILDGIGDFFRDLFDVIANAVKALLDGLKYLFIPRADYFTRLWQRIHGRFSEKFGFIASLILDLGERFGRMKAYQGGVEQLFVLRFPAGHLLGSASVNLLDGAFGVIEMIRGALSGSVVVITTLICYKKVIGMINS